MMKCYFCDVETIKHGLVSDYNQCPVCRTALVDSDNMGANYDSTDMVNLYESRLKGKTQNDVKHYLKLTNTMWFNLFKNRQTFSNIHAFGGGFPKLESYLNFNILTSYDMMQELYVRNASLFLDNYPVKGKKIRFTKQNISPEFIKQLDISSNDLVTFVHFLEHFKQNDIIKMIDAVPLNIPILIYGPDVSAARNKGWCHFIATEHLTIFNVDFISYYFENRYNINIISKCKYSDDMFLVFSKKK